MASSTAYDVSLIVPIYNVADYLPQCLDSIARQTVFDRIEVLLVDDGSTDASAEIAVRFALQHANVRVISQPNRGQGAARNRGLREATAEFVAFLDSDDVLPENSVELRLGAMGPGVDVVVGDMQTFPRETTWSWSGAVRVSNRVIDGIQEAPELLANASPCNKLFRAAYFRAVSFEEGRHFEDAFVVVPALLNARRLALVSDVVYFYRKRAAGGSTMDGLFSRSENYWDHLVLAERLEASVLAADAAKQRLVTEYNVRAMRGFLLRAPERLPGAQIRAYFYRAQALFGTVAPEDIALWVTDLRHRLAFAAVLLDDFDLFFDRFQNVRGVMVVDRIGTLKLRSDVDVAVRPLLAITGAEFHVEHVSGGARAQSLTVEGRLSLPGVPASGIAEHVRVRLASRGVPMFPPVGVTIRHAATSDSPVTIVGWTAELPSRALRNGKLTLDAHIFSEGGQFTIRARPSLGLRRRSRMVRTRSTRSLFIPEDDGRLTVLTRRVSKRGNRLRWHLALVIDDLDHVIHRRPFAWARVARLLSAPLAGRSPLWLVGERGDTAQDNGFEFFRWSRDNADGVRVRYVLDRESPAWRALEDRRGVIPRGGLRHKFWMFHASVLISSHDIDAYLLPPSWHRENFRTHLAYRLGQKRVFLQHGVVFNDVAGPLARESTGLDVFVTSVEPEHEYLRQNTRYSDELKLTGMPRYDSLVRAPSREVLLMPTWRKYLVLPSYVNAGHDPGTFFGSEYQRFFTRLLQEPRLAEVLEHHDYSLAFVPHAEIASQFADLELASDRVHVVEETGLRLQDRIRSAAVFMTDYTSVMFDAAYLGIPVLQMPFDLDEFHARHYGRGWLDNSGAEFWPVARSVASAIEELDRILAAGAVVDDVFQTRIDGLFVHRDRANSRRVYEAICALG